MSICDGKQNGYREQRVWDAESGACVQVGARSSAAGTENSSAPSPVEERSSPGTIQRTTQAKYPHDFFISHTSSVREEGRWRVAGDGEGK